MNTNIGKLIAGLVTVVAWMLGATCNADNPIIQTCFTADPAPMVHDGTVYLYTGHDEDDATGFKMRDWKCFTSTDMVNWTDRGAVISTKNFSWATDYSAWAAQCIYRNGKFYFYTTSAQKRNGTMSIGVGVSDSPTGPFVDALGKPLIANSREDIDPTVFIDDDGQAYMYWGNPNLYYVKLNDDMISYSGEVVKLPRLRNYQEGPWLYKRNGRYYMAYASTCCPEGIGYAMSDTPTGPWELKGQIMDPNRLSDGNHPGIIDYKGKTYVFGFNYKLNWEISPVKRERRSVCLAEMTYNEDGTIPKLPWWTEAGVAQVGTFNPFTQVEAATICYSEGIKTVPRGGDQRGVDVTATENGAYIKIKGVDFGASGATNFLVSVAAAADGATLALRLDSETGTQIGTLKVKATGSLDKWETQSCRLIGARGVHDLYLKFFGDQTPVMHVSWWKCE